MFDCVSGESINPRNEQLERYEVRVNGRRIEVSWP